MYYLEDSRLDLYCCLTAEDFADEPNDHLYQPTTRPIGSTSRRSGGGPGLLRYPGGKTKLVRKITARLESMVQALSPSAEYREPFLGPGSIAMTFLKHQRDRPAWINDRDPAMAALWDCVSRRSDGLKLMIYLFPDVMCAEYFYFFKRHLLAITDSEDLQRYDLVWIGLAKLAIHQMAFSGLGTCAGGPMGGRTQRGQGGVRSRYSPDLLCAKIDRCRDILS